MSASGTGELDAFCERLADDPRGAGAWRREDDPQIFAVRMVEAGRAAGYAFSPGDVTALLDGRWRAWRERSLD